MPLPPGADIVLLLLFMVEENVQRVVQFVEEKTLMLSSVRLALL